MARSSKGEKNLEVLQTLKQWSARYNFSGDSYVSGLSQALENRSNLPFWSTMSATEFLPKAVISAPRSQLIFYLSLVRNLLIFAPVAITWIAIGEASRAFAVYTEQNPDAVANFLEFWQNGYGILAAEWTLSRVAILDASILVLIILLIIATTSLSQSAARHAHELEKVADDDRMKVAIAVDSYLFEKRSVTNVTLNQGLSRALQELRNTSGALNRTAKIVEKAEKGTPTSRKILAEIKKISNSSYEK